MSVLLLKFGIVKVRWKEREKEGTDMIKDQTRGVVDTWYKIMTTWGFPEHQHIIIIII